MMYVYECLLISTGRKEVDGIIYVMEFIPF